MDSDERRAVSKLRVDVDSSPSLDSGDDREGDDLQEEVIITPVAWSHHHTVAGNINRRQLLSKQPSMKETTREAKWEKRRRQQILPWGSLVAVNEAAAARAEGFGSSPIVDERGRCLTDADLDELRGTFELGFGFDEEKGGAGLCDTLPALDLYFAVNRQLSDGPKLWSPTSTLSASSSTMISDASSSLRGPDAWTIFCPGDNPQLIKTRLRHWAQVVACSVKHGC
uniref:Uncharacterized protein n=1 Tax=Oryza punctata TaxID=4537 RepID=A0A0E0JZJ7_ORYPU